MPKKAEDVDEAGETVELDGSGNKDGAKNSRKQRQRRSRAKRVRIIGALVAVILLIVIIIGAWYIYSSLGDGHPEWLQTIPGLHYHPKSKPKSFLITYKIAEKDSYEPWVEVINDFLIDYTSANQTGIENVVNCDYDLFPKEDEVCSVDTKLFGACTKEYFYGYHKGSPCIFLKIHKFQGWVPEYYNDSSQLPETMPEELKNGIKEKEMHHPEELQNVWVTCEGESPADVENIGPVTYIPGRGFPSYYFPYRGIEGYLSPLIALHLERPQRGILINIECKLWAKNIAHDREKGVGVVHFEIMLD